MYKLDVHSRQNTTYITSDLDLPTLEGSNKGYVVSAMLMYLERRNIKAYLSDIADPDPEKCYLRSAVFKDDDNNQYIFREYKWEHLKKEINCYLWTGSNFDDLKKVFGHLVVIDFDLAGNSYLKIRNSKHINGFQVVNKNSYLYLDTAGEINAITEELLKKQGRK